MDDDDDDDKATTPTATPPRAISISGAPSSPTAGAAASTTVSTTFTCPSKRRRMDPNPTQTNNEISIKFESQEFLTDAANTLKASFSSCTVDISSLKKLLPEDASSFDGSSTVTGIGEDKFLYLSFLDELREEEDESFLPQTIYIRDCMKFIFQLSETDDRKPMYGDHILIGSPGVGKSVLFFLMALSKARSKPLVYFRKTKGLFCSVFFMNATENGQVHIVFSRSLLKRKTTTNTILEFLDDQKVHNSLYFTFVDGPRYDDKEDTLSYDYFCTSGGCPFPKDEVIDRTFIWILDAWTEEEVIDALTQKSAQELSPSASEQGSSVGTMDKEHATELYSLCGGRIRRIIKATKDREEIESLLQGKASTLNKETIELALTSTKRGDSSPDSIRSMFRIKSGSTKLMRAIQIVDSRYALDLLKGSFDVQRLLEAFHLAKSLDANTVQGCYFELCCHCWFKTKISAPKTSTGEQEFPLRDYRQGTGTGAASVRQLTNAECYWVPSVNNFPDIDAAFVHQGTFYALQYTGAEQRSFYCERFGVSVLAVVQQKGPSFTKVCVVFVVPQCCNEHFTRPFMPGDVSFFTESSGGTCKEKTCCSLIAETWFVQTTTEQRLSMSLSTSLFMSLSKVTY